MAKRVRYDGPYDEVRVSLPEGKYVDVKRGALLPTEVDGEAVPAAVRDNLIEQADWSETTQSTPKKEG